MNKIIEHNAEICVIGGGLAGMCAAISAARKNRKVVLIHDRPMLGGNCSSEVRMWVCGARGKNRRETGILEEIMLENAHCNSELIYPMWDAVLYSSVHSEKNIELLLNCSVNDAETDGEHIVSVSGWQLTTYKTHRVKAKIFIDCSGDSILAELTGAEYRHGREAKEEYGEEAAPNIPDSKTMGNSILFQPKETDHPVPFIAPPFARKFNSEEEFRHRNYDPKNPHNNFWWLELGGEKNTIDDAEEIRDDLLALAYGTWDYAKNKSQNKSDNWELDFMGWLPGKRESRRYVGRHTLTQPEVQAGGLFDDTIAYGGWQIDDHPPAGFEYDGPPNKNYPCPSPFGIPYGCLYSKNIDNLMFAGRNISVTHAAMAASRVMATCALLGQAAGTAAALAVGKNTDPDGVSIYIRELQEQLMYDDCWLPRFRRTVSELCLSSELLVDGIKSDKAEALRNGIDRPTDEEGDNGFFLPLESSVSYRLPSSSYVEEVRIIFDSDLDRTTTEGGTPGLPGKSTLCCRPLNFRPVSFPKTMIRSFEIKADGKTIFTTDCNYQRLNIISVKKEVSVIELIPHATYGSEDAHIFSFDFR